MEESPEKHKPSAYCELYKASIQIDQNKRRHKLLQEQKRLRAQLVDQNRGLDEPTKPRNANKKPNKYIKEHSNKIMLSEWFVEIPEDFDVSWFMKICPEGHRNLVVAENFHTATYSKSGRFEHKFNSLLPGGYEKPRTTILDCIWNQKTKTFYVLDVLVWSGQDMATCEAEFRFFWLHNKFSEMPDLELPSSLHTYSFKYVPHIVCDYLTIKNYLENYPHFPNDLPEADGLLFYHKEASYSQGRTPLVGWLKPFMAPEILNIPVAEEYSKQKPEKYISLTEHIAYYEKQKRRKKHKTSKTNVEMEIV